MNTSCGELPMGNTVGIHLVGVEVNGVPLNDATCTFTLFDLELVAPVDDAEDVAMPYANVPGRYRGPLASTVALVEGRRYRIVATATKSGVGVGQWEHEVIAVKRRASRRT